MVDFLISKDVEVLLLCCLKLFKEFNELIIILVISFEGDNFFNIITEKTEKTTIFQGRERS